MHEQQHSAPQHSPNYGHHAPYGQPVHPPEEERKNRKLFLLLLFPFAGLLLIVGAGAAFLLLRDDGGGEPVLAAADDGERFFLGRDTTDDDPTVELADEVGIDPFVSPQDLLDAFEDLTWPPAEETPHGLYGGTLDNTCDPQRLVDYLEANPAKAEAWAQVQGINIGDLRSYVMALTPAVLSSYTAVTNHSFNNNMAVPIQATLEVGTAVLVDSKGIPRARCYCGNPLTPPAPASTTATTTPTTAAATTSTTYGTATTSGTTPTTASTPTSTKATTTTSTSTTGPSTTTTYPSTTVAPTTTKAPTTTVKSRPCDHGDLAEPGALHMVINVAANDPDGGLVTRSGPGTGSPRIGVLAYDMTDLEVIGCELAPNGDVWWNVKGHGWVNASFLAQKSVSVCPAGPYNPVGKNLVATGQGAFDTLAGVDTAYVYTEGGTTWVQIEYGDGGLSTAVDLGANRDFKARTITGSGVYTPIASPSSVLVLFDSSTAGGAGNAGTQLVVASKGCAAVHVTFNGRPTDIDSSFTVGAPTELTCETGASGQTSLIVYQGRLDSSGHSLEFEVEELGYNAATASLSTISTTVIPDGSQPAWQPCS